MEKYVFHSYNPIFVDLFEQEKKRLLSRLSVACIIEHVGSTAVTGLGGKGIIDIAIAAAFQDFSCITQELLALGYLLRPQNNTVSWPFFKTFLEDTEIGTRTYHLHLITPDSREWNDFLMVRDALRKEPELAVHYANLKNQAAILAEGNGAVYRALKGSFLKKIIQNKNSK